MATGAPGLLVELTLATPIRVGEIVDLAPEAADPKNPFGVLRDEQGPVATKVRRVAAPA